MMSTYYSSTSSSYKFSKLLYICSFCSSVGGLTTTTFNILSPQIIFILTQFDKFLALPLLKLS